VEVAVRILVLLFSVASAARYVSEVMKPILA